eukprot:scaffold1499_cov255-Pinguiococcus_pyrenoidosus.AAC.21
MQYQVHPMVEHQVIRRDGDVVVGDDDTVVPRVFHECESAGEAIAPQPNESDEWRSEKGHLRDASRGELERWSTSRCVAQCHGFAASEVRQTCAGTFPDFVPTMTSPMVSASSAIRCISRTILVWRRGRNEGIRTEHLSDSFALAGLDDAKSVHVGASRRMPRKEGVAQRIAHRRQLMDSRSARKVRPGLKGCVKVHHPRQSAFRALFSQSSGRHGERGRLGQEHRAHLPLGAAAPARIQSLQERLSNAGFSQRLLGPAKPGLCVRRRLDKKQSCIGGAAPPRRERGAVGEVEEW